MIDTNGYLNVLEDFVVDDGLPKFAKPKPGDDLVMYSQARGGGTIIRNPGAKRGGVYQVLWVVWMWMLALVSSRKMPVQKVFAEIRQNERQIELPDERAAGLRKGIDTAKQAGQKALQEKLEDALNAHMMEIKFKAMWETPDTPYRVPPNSGPTYLEEADLVRFYKQCERGLRLDWIRHFVRQIPTDVLERKMRADELWIFDNYVVLHFDPKAKAFAETKADIAKRKDPILFGLMKGRRRLYFIGDWVDEYCDLTLDQIADALGSSVLKEVGEDDS